MVEELDGRVALVTGAGRGQGRSHALALAAAGADVVVTDVCHDIESVPYGLADGGDLEETAQLIEKLGRAALAVAADVRGRAAMQRVVDEALGQFGHLDIVVANAGICGFGAMPSLTEAQWDDMLAVNLTGVFNTFRAAVPHMTERRYGRLIAMVDTPMVHNPALYSLFAPDVDAPTKDLVQAQYEAMNPMGVAWLDPQEISHAVLFLASDRSAYISGETIEVSAGGSAQR